MLSVPQVDDDPAVLLVEEDRLGAQRCYRPRRGHDDRQLRRLRVPEDEVTDLLNMLFQCHGYHLCNAHANNLCWRAKAISMSQFSRNSRGENSTSQASGSG